MDELTSAVIRLMHTFGTSSQPVHRDGRVVGFVMRLFK